MRGVMRAKPTRITPQVAVRIDALIGEAHMLLARELLGGTATERVAQAEQKLHDLRNEFAALTGLGFRFAACDGDLLEC